MLSFVSFLNDAASEMIVPLLPVFLTQVLGGTAVSVGAVEGTADAVAALIKLQAGRIGDRVGRQRPLILSGYGLAGFARAAIALAATTGMVGALRIVDRVGKGLRSAPRDALLAGAVEPADRARVFSFHRALDNAGALVGAGTAFLLLTREGLDLRMVFLCSAIPALLAILLIALAVREDGHPPPPGTALPGWPPAALRGVLAALGLFTVGHVGDTLLLLRASELGASPATLTLLWMALHLVKSLTGLRAAWVADRIGRLPLVGVGWLWCAGIYGALTLATTLPAFAALFVAYGLYHGLVEGTERAVVADRAGPDARGTAFGWYHLTSGLGALPAGLLLGGVWAAAGAPTAFAVAAGLTTLATLLLALAGRVDHRA